MGKTKELVLCLALGLVLQVHAVTRPPGIFIQPDYDVYYKAGETVEMPCVAEGSPRPVYTWERNGIDFNPSGNDDRVVQLANVGTIVITRPEDKDEGIFQCFAKNSYGTSLSININLREAKLKSFVVEADRTKYPQLGREMTLDCVPPESIPPANVYWIIKKPYGGFDAVNYDARVSMDHEYRLRFTNVRRIDKMGGRAYACMAMNGIMRLSSQGPQFFIEPQGGNEELRPVSYMWASPEDHFGLRGNNFTVKCIFAGNPTPDVHWERTDGAPLPDRAKIQSFGQELMIQDLQFDDAGNYECWATNTNTQTRVQRTVTIRVESRPYWLLEPEDVEIGVGGTAVFNCLAKSVPEPVYHWFINGVSLERVLQEGSDPRINAARFKLPRRDRIVFTDLTREDPMVIQCNATNKHGYIWGDVFLNVLSEAPTIIKPPDNRKVVAEGTTINVTCRVTGKPDPIITWFKDDQQITGGRYKIQTSGDLYIKQVVLSDAGLFRCEAENSFNKTSRAGLLLVRRKTKIEQAPMDLEVNAGYDAKFTCSGTTDPEEVEKLQIKWLKDNKEISSVVQRMTTNIQDNSLTISGTIVRDSGSYTCIATNGLDAAEASAMLTVKDKPDAASQVRIEKCQERNATIVWMPGSYNNAPVQYYIIQYNTTFNPDTWTFAERVDSIYNTANISLSPWVNYTFRVIAYNKIGESDPSFPSPTVCRTKDAVPDANPANLRTIGDRLGELHIEWTPMPQIKHNGEGFQYELQVSREGFENQVVPIPIEDWRTYEHSMDRGGSEVYEPYKIQIRARNSVGFARQDPVIIRGFTGENIPTVTCTNLEASKIADTYAVLQWDFDYTQINATATAIKGEFRGFKMQFWQQGDRTDTLREWDISPEEAMESRVGNRFNATVEDLLPYTTVEVTVAVMNNYYVSPPSDVYRFQTDPGFPGPVELFRPINIGDNHVNLEWKPPEENRGDILGYDIGYQSVIGLDLGEVQERDPQINDAYATTAMLSGLLINTKYRIYIWARTTKGRGEGYFIELITSMAGDPQAPRFTITDVGQHHINVSWWINPYASSGTVVYVEYRKEDAAEWLRTTDEVISSWKNITNLESGETYDLRVVSTNGGVSRASHIEEVTTDGVALASALVGNWGWFLGMMLALLLFIGLIIFFIVIFKRGKRFKQKDSPSNSYYGGDTGSYSDTGQIPKRSADFGPEPRGYTNDYYDERDRSYHDDQGHDGYYGAGRGDERRYNDDKHNDYDDEGGFADRDRYNDKHYDDRRNDYDDRRNNYDDSRDYDDKRNSYDDHGKDDRHSRDYDRRDDDRYRPPSYSDTGDRRYPDTREEPYEEYERKPSASYDPDYDNRDYREPSRFDRHGVPVDIRDQSPKNPKDTFV
ncbi:neuroglian-like isoform X2 [Littorina saxatilis]|uniref:Neuroglian n=1 Tax=Littorina saxatilis TaxID=31220 RepID=A0AAN9GD11_9CAEN